jgi:hypothetical protein
MPHTAPHGASQALPPDRRRHRHIPRPYGPGSISVNDGALFVGTIVLDDGSHFAFDVAGTLIGEFPTRQAAMRALPGADYLGAVDGPAGRLP